MKLTKSNLMDVAYCQLLSNIQTIKKEKNLSTEDLENLLYRILVDVKIEKEVIYSTNLVESALQLQKLEEEKKKVIQENAIKVKEEKKEE